MNFLVLNPFFCLDSDPYNFCLDPYQSSVWTLIRNDFFSPDPYQMISNTADKNYAEPLCCVQGLGADGAGVPGRLPAGQLLQRSNHPHLASSRQRYQVRYNIYDCCVQIFFRPPASQVQMSARGASPQCTVV